VEDRPVGASGVEISVVGLGGFELGPEPGEAPDVASALGVISTAYDNGVTWLDTSENYLATANESLIGDALSRFGQPFQVCSKVCPYAALSGGASGYRPDQVHAACRDSLRRLRRDHIDIYLLHYPARDGVPLADTWGAMTELVDQGLVHAIGMSNYDYADVQRCHAQRRVDNVQTGLSLIDYLDDRPMIEQLRDIGVSVTIYEPLASGFLAGVSLAGIRAQWGGGVWEESSFWKRLVASPYGERSEAVCDGLRPIAHRLGVTVAQVAIAWVLSQPGVTAALAGSSKPGHMRDNAAAATVDLSDVIDEVEALIPLGPCFID
jgi:aryl-alcohol dehydrogenase-like predicted oxidoreductase